MIKYKGINHMALATADMDRTIRFWRDLLGMRLVVGLGRPGGRLYFFEISQNDLLAFFEWPHVEPVQEKDHGYPVKGPFIFDHVAFGVETLEDLWALKDRIETANPDLWVSEVIDHGFIYSIYTFDPNGIPIEFSWDVPGLDIRRNPRMIDRGRSKVADEGAEPHAGHWPEVRHPTPAEERQVYPGEGSELVEEGKKSW
jgi:catechol 2,3-dioxygenase-like lactoylglutathione lyase family enzyme